MSLDTVEHMRSLLDRTKNAVPRRHNMNYLIDEVEMVVFSNWEYSKLLQLI